jgi:hypothetical protein
MPVGFKIMEITVFLKVSQPYDITMCVIIFYLLLAFEYGKGEGVMDTSLWIKELITNCIEALT